MRSNYGKRHGDRISASTWTKIAFAFSTCLTLAAIYFLMISTTVFQGVMAMLAIVLFIIAAFLCIPVRNGSNHDFDPR
jgi:nitrate/nitrite transporter NarK